MTESISEEDVEALQEALASNRRRGWDSEQAREMARKSVEARNDG